MENRERRSTGFQFPHHEKLRVIDAFLQPGKIVKEKAPNMVQLREAIDFLQAVENRASKRGLTPEGSVDVIIKIQETAADPSRALQDLTEAATEAGFQINDDATQENPGSIWGSIPLKKAPDLAIDMYKNPNLSVVELPPFKRS
jgi:hypothetical protein